MNRLTLSLGRRYDQQHGLNVVALRWWMTCGC